MRTKHTFLFTMVLGLVWCGFLFAYQNGPDPGSNGVFGPGTDCRSCHEGNPLNAAGGTLTLAGLPDNWTPGQIYPLTITIQKSGAAIYGFQLSAVRDSVAQPQQAGTLTKGGVSGTQAFTRIDIITGGGVQYAQHNSINAALAPTTTFLVNWTAPATAGTGTVRFNLAANAGNRDSQNSGDFIYTLVERRSPATAAAPDFSLSGTPAANTVTAGASATFTVGATGLNGFASIIGLSVTGLPPGASGDFVPASMAVDSSSILTVSTAATMAPGTYPLTISGIGGNVTHTASVSITVVAPLPQGEAFRVFNVANLGGNSSSTDGSGDLGVGYAKIEANAGNTTPAGVEIFGFRSNNVLVSETGVPASPLLTSGRIYAEVNGPVNTGLAIANPNPQTATISFFFTNANGVDSAVGITTIGPNGQSAKFLNEPPYDGGSNIQGTFSFTSTEPVSVIALRGFINEVRGEFLMTTLPVINTAATAGTGIQILPHFANGGGWTTQVILINPGDTVLTGSVQFIRPDGTPISLTSDPQYSIPRRSSRKLVTSGPVAGGSVRVVPTASGGAAPTPLVVFSFKPQNITLSEAGAPANSSTAFRMYVESLGVPTQSGNIQSGIAVTTTAAANVLFELFNLDGSATGLTKTQALPASGQYAAFLAEILPGVPQSFRGVLRISSASAISVVGLRGRYNERSEFLITTTPPTSESAPASIAPLFFPHLVNGGGYTTQFILFSGTAGQATAGNLRFYTKDGIELKLILNQ